MKKLLPLFFSILLTLPLSAEQKRPNILFIFADDQSPFDFKIYNERSVLDTPNIDRLAREGMVLDGAYHMGSWSGAVCLPSRTMVMTGRSVWHIPNRKKGKANAKRKNAKLAPGQTGNLNEGKGNFVPVDMAQNSLPAVFNRAGYDTMRTCKNGNSYEAANKLFTVRRDATKRGGTAETGSAWHAQQVLDYLGEREETKDSDPFLIYYGFSHPHDVRDGTPELLAKYGATNHKDRNSLPEINAKTPPLPINYLKAHPFPHGQPGLRDEVSVKGVWEKRDERTIRNEIGRQFACSENIDIQIGRVLEKLEKMGGLDNTYIIYTADHGMAIGRHGLQGKQNLYQHTWRVPFVVRGPGIKAGTRAEGNVYLMDVLATLCDLAGIKPPETNEGQSMVPIFKGEKPTLRDTLFGVYCGGTKPGMRCVKKGDWKLIKYDTLDGKVRETQLFNLGNNPHEFLAEHEIPLEPRRKVLPDGTVELNPKASGPKRNLAGVPLVADKQKELEALLLSEMERLNDPYRLWDQPKKK